jgi:hypothetical protein
MYIRCSPKVSDRGVYNWSCFNLQVCYSINIILDKEKGGL